MVHGPPIFHPQVQQAEALGAEAAASPSSASPSPPPPPYSPPAAITDLVIQPSAQPAEADFSLVGTLSSSPPLSVYVARSAQGLPLLQLGVSSSSSSHPTAATSTRGAEGAEGVVWKACSEDISGRGEGASGVYLWYAADPHPADELAEHRQPFVSQIQVVQTAEAEAWRSRGWQTLPVVRAAGETERQQTAAASAAACSPLTHLRSLSLSVPALSVRD